MDEPAIDECFRLLRLRRGADFAAVKQAYRKNLYKCHPDRFQGKADLLPVAERKTKRLVQVYGVLERWYQENGGFDDVSNPRGTGNGQGWTEAPEDPSEQEVPPRRRRFSLGLAAVAVVAVLAALAWWLSPEPPARLKPSPPATDDASDEGAPAPGKPQAMPAEAPSASATQSAQLAAMTAERDRVKAAWIQAYARAGEAERIAAEKELADSQAQYDRDVRDNAPEIKDAQDETDRQNERMREESASARVRFAGQLQSYLAARRRDYDTWLLARGEEAVSMVRKLRARENAEMGVFSDTEDPRRIFEFWTAGEAGAPEINIAAKTGVAVQEPDGRFFPHFRSNIFLYDPEGRALRRMMESIVERHGALAAELADRTMAAESELADWDARHPLGPVDLGAVQQSALEGRDRAVERLSRAKARMEDAGLALGPSRAAGAFERSPEGRKWAERIAAARKAALAARGAR